MPKTSLVAYSLRIMRRGAKEPVKLRELDGHAEFYDAFVEFVRKLRRDEAQVDQAHERAMRLRLFDHADDLQRVWGVTRGGSYGYEADLYDIETGAEAQRSRSQAELIPFYFVCDLNGGRDFGVLLLQRFGNLGITSHFWQELKEWFADRFPAYVIRMERIVPEAVLDELFAGNLLKAIHFVKLSVPPDAIEAIGGGVDRIPGSADLRIQVRGGMPRTVVARINRWYRSANRVPARGLFELRGEFEDFDYDTVKLEVAVGNSVRKVDLDKLDTIRASFDIDSDIEKDAGGHPEFESIHRVARDILGRVIEAFT